MTILQMFLMVLAAVLFLLAGSGVPTRFNLIGVGLFFWILAELVARAPLH